MLKIQHHKVVQLPDKTITFKGAFYEDPVQLAIKDYLTANHACVQDVFYRTLRKVNNNYHGINTPYENYFFIGNRTPIFLERVYDTSAINYFNTLNIVALKEDKSKVIARLPLFRQIQYNPSHIPPTLMNVIRRPLIGYTKQIVSPSEVYNLLYTVFQLLFNTNWYKDPIALNMVYELYNYTYPIKQSELCFFLKYTIPQAIHFSTYYKDKLTFYQSLDTVSFSCNAFWEGNSTRTAMLKENCIVWNNNSNLITLSSYNKSEQLFKQINTFIKNFTSSIQFTN